MNIKVDVQGLKGVEDALAEFAPKLVKKAFREAMKAAAQPEIDAAKGFAPLLKKPSPARYPGELRDSIDVKISLKKGSVLARIGPKRTKGESNQSPGAWGLMIEFGSIHNQPMPYLRPAFDQTKELSVAKFAEVLRGAIQTMGSK
jgi:HK97 gp10 family phage protein